MDSNPSKSPLYSALMLVTHVPFWEFKEEQWRCPWTTSRLTLEKDLESLKLDLTLTKKEELMEI